MIYNENNKDVFAGGGKKVFAVDKNVNKQKAAKKTDKTFGYVVYVQGSKCKIAGWADF